MDEVERGQTIVVTRGGRRIAAIGPISASNGAAVEGPAWPTDRGYGCAAASERGRAQLAEVVAEDDDLVIAAITVAELRTGVERATDRHRAARAEFLSQVLKTFPVEPYDLATAQVHGQLLAHVHRGGATRGAHDLLIAATALAARRTVLTTDRNARFDDLPGVDSLVLG